MNLRTALMILGLGAIAGCQPRPAPAEESATSTDTAASTGDDGGSGVHCTHDFHCADRCYKGECVEGCGPDLPCPGSMHCADAVCVPDLTSPSQCANSLSLQPFSAVALQGEEPARTVGAIDVDGDAIPELFGDRDGLWMARLSDLTPAKIGVGGMVGGFDTNTGDVDGDGDVDILPGSGQVVLLGDGAGSFSEAPGPDPAMLDGALGDLDADGRAEIVGFWFTCPLDAPPETECWGHTLGRWLRADAGWKRVISGPVWPEPANVMVAPLLAGGGPIGVYETHSIWILIGTFTETPWPTDSFKVSRVDRSDIAALRRAGDDRSELMRVGVRNHWTWGARIRYEGGYSEVPEQWVIPGELDRAAAGDVDLDGNDDLVLVGGGAAFLVLDRPEDPLGICTIAIPEAAAAIDVALVDLDGVGAPELILGAPPGIIAYSLTVGP